MNLKRSATRSLVLLVTIALVAPLSAAQTDKVDQYIEQEMKKHRIPAIGLAVLKDGKIIKAKGYGIGNVELNIPATADTVFKIGSVSKQFIATGIVLLREEGKLKFEDKVSKYMDGTPESWKEITIYHLLTHTSGIMREGPAFDPFKIQPDADVIKSAYNQPLRFQPGEKWEYCNVGYFTLAEIITRVSGKPWGEYLDEKVFKPLGMSSTRPTTTREVVKNRADGYVWSKETLNNAQEFFAVRPSGAFLSTANDLAKWEMALSSSKIITKELFREMSTPVKLNDGKTFDYGYGWQLGSFQGHKTVNHGGSLPGFRAQFMRLVDDKLTVIVLTNLDGANPNAIAQGVAALYF